MFKKNHDFETFGDLFWCRCWRTLTHDLGIVGVTTRGLVIGGFINKIIINSLRSFLTAPQASVMFMTSYGGHT